MGFALVILILSTLPGPEIPEVKIKYLDKGVHFFMYAVLCFYSIKGFIKQTAFPFLKCFCCSVSFVYCSLYGGVLELIQHYFIQDRTGEWPDFFANSLGSLVVAILFSVKNKSL